MVTQDNEVMMLMIVVFLGIAAFCTTAFPALYLLFPWKSTLLGKLLMLQGVAFALAMDATLLFWFWVPDNIQLILWLNVFVFGLIAVATGALTVTLCRTNQIKDRVRRIFKRKKVQDDRDARGVRSSAPEADPGVHAQ